MISITGNTLSASYHREHYVLEYAYQKIKFTELHEYSEKVRIAIKLIEQSKEHKLFQVDYLNTAINYVGDFLIEDICSETIDSLKVSVDHSGRIKYVEDMQAAIGKCNHNIQRAIRKQKQLREMYPYCEDASHMALIIQRVLLKNRHLLFLFQPWNGEYLQGSKRVETLIPAYFESIDLPLSEILRFEKTADGKTVSGTIEINQSALDKATLRRSIKEAVDMYDIRMDIATDYESVYHFNSYDVLLDAQQYLSANIANAYEVTEARKLSA